MVRLILKYLNKIKQLFVIVPVVITTMIVAGLFFANKKSQPEFASKAERIMFETKNKSPKYVITMPKKNVKKKEVVSEVDKPAEPEEDKIGRVKTNNEKLSELDIPFLSRLSSSVTHTPLTHLRPSEIVSETNDGKTLPVKKGTLKAWEVYGRKADVMPMFSKVVVVIKNMGGNKSNADLIIKNMPDNVSLSFSPYTSDLAKMVYQARENGHETYLDVVLPSKSVLQEDAGPLALDFSKTPQENVAMLEEILSDNIAVGGFTMREGIDTPEYKSQFEAVMKMFEERGLLLFDAMHGNTVNQSHADGLDRVRADIVIDSDFERKVIQNKLQQAEQLAYHNGNVVIALDPKPVAVLAVAEWLQTFSAQLSYEEMKTQNINSFDKPLVLVPLSNLAVEY